MVTVRCFHLNMWEKNWKYWKDQFELLEILVQLNIPPWMLVKQESKLQHDRSTLRVVMLRLSDLSYKHSVKDQQLTFLNYMAKEVVDPIASAQTSDPFTIVSSRVPHLV